MAKHEQVRASAWLNILTVAGTVAGNVIVVATYQTGHPLGTIATLVALNIAVLVVMLRRVREPQPTTPRSTFVLGEFFRKFYVDPRAHSNFYWVLVTRLLGNMGVWSVFTFLLFYFKDVIGVAKPAQVLPALLGIGAVLAVPPASSASTSPHITASSASRRSRAGSWRSAHSTLRSSLSTQVLRWSFRSS